MMVLQLVSAAGETRRAERPSLLLLQRQEAHEKSVRSMTTPKPKGLKQSPNLGTLGAFKQSTFY